MNFRHTVAFAAIASIGLCVMSAQPSDAGDSNDFSRDDVIASAMVAEAENSQPSSKKWNPLTAAKRTASKAAAVAISGAQRITKGISGTVAKLFDNDEVQPSDNGLDGVTGKKTGPIPLEQQSPAVVSAINKDQLVLEPEAMNKPTVVPVDENAEKPDTPLAEIAPKKQVSRATREKQSAIKLAATPAGSDHKSTNLQCEKAKTMIGKYAFSEVESISCKGDVYHFKATRDGEKFLIKVNALKGDLLEVEKLETGPVAAGNAGMPWHH